MLHTGNDNSIDNVTQKKSDVLIRNGKIHKVGENLEAPEGCEVYDATDRLGKVFKRIGENSLID